MFKIGDFSKLGQVSAHRLRRYDKLGLLTPSHTDQFTGYRYYTIDQLARLNRIVALSNLGFSLEQIGKLLNDDNLSVEQLHGMLRMRQAEIERQLATAQEQLDEVRARLQQIEQEGQPSPYEIVIKSVAAQTIASVRQMVPSVSEMEYFCREMYGTLYGRLQQHNITPIGSEIMLFHTEEYREAELDVEATLPVAAGYLTTKLIDEPFVFRELPASDLTAALIYEGPFSEVQMAVMALLQWVGSHNHLITGPIRELRLSDPVYDEEVGVETAVLELQLPIKKSPI